MSAKQLICDLFGLTKDVLIYLIQFHKENLNLGNNI